MTAYILTAEAEYDLRSVICYTCTQWGAAQVRRYVSGLERGIATLAEGRGSFKDMGALYPGVKDGTMPAPIRLLSASRGCARPHRSDFSRTNGSDEAFGGSSERMTFGRRRDYVSARPTNRRYCVPEKRIVISDPFKSETGQNQAVLLSRQPLHHRRQDFTTCCSLFMCSRQSASIRA